MMLQIQQLKVQAFRCLSQMDVSFGPCINLIDGLNGSGKTSILEAIYYLSLARSFRSPQHRFVIQRGESSCYLHAKLLSQDLLHSIGIERHMQGHSTHKLNDQVLSTITPLTQQLPLCLLHPERSRQLNTGSKPRRALLDWGLFYQRPDFLPIWRRYQQARSQRNAALKQALPASGMAVWNQMLCELAPQIDAMRTAYLDELGLILAPLCEQLLQQPLNLSWSYVRGWPRDMSLNECFEQHLARDMALGYTQYGPHRADFVLKSHQQPVHQVLSQGQQKLLAYALLLAQMELLHRSQPGVLLIDDLPAELDQHSIAVISDKVLTMDLQCFVTAVSADALPALRDSEECHMFHVKHGQVSSLSAKEAA